MMNWLEILGVMYLITIAICILIVTILCKRANKLSMDEDYDYGVERIKIQKKMKEEK